MDLKIYITLVGFAFIKSNESKSVTLLFTKNAKERFARFKRENERFALFCQKTRDLSEKPKSEFPTLLYTAAARGKRLEHEGEGTGYYNIHYTIPI